jgi:hypothetical protein
MKLEHRTGYSRRLSADLRRIASSLLLRILQYPSSSLLTLLGSRRKYSVRNLFGVPPRMVCSCLHSSDFLRSGALLLRRIVRSSRPALPGARRKRPIRKNTGALGLALAASALLFVIPSCTSGEADPSKGTYTVQFPSTAAAVATDFVQVLVFDVKKPEDRDGLCQELITARLTTPASLAPSIPPAPAANICEMRAGLKGVTVPYGEHALLAIGQKKDRQDQLKDFLIGCTIMTLGDGDAPLPIPVRLVSVNAPVPATTCASVSEYCDGKCQ